jgi:hypothetical protein
MNLVGKCVAQTSTAPEHWEAGFRTECGPMRTAGPFPKLGARTCALSDRFTDFSLVPADIVTKVSRSMHSKLPGPG